MRFIILFLFGFASLAFCDYDQKKYGYQKVGNPYNIGKSTYYPKKRDSFIEEGYISWYGPKFHGKKTANGAIFNQNSYTVAHKTLALPSVIEITNLENNKKVIAVVNDRGPFSETQSRILDASKQVAKDLGFIEKGVITGRIRLLKKETDDLLKGRKVKLGPIQSSSYLNYSSGSEETVKQESKKSNVDNSSSVTNEVGEEIYFVEVEKFLFTEERKKAINYLRSEGLKKISIVFDVNDDYQDVEIIRLGPFSQKDAYKVLTKLKNLGYYNSEIFILD